MLSKINALVSKIQLLKNEKMKHHLLCMLTHFEAMGSLGHNYIIRLEEDFNFFKEIEASHEKYEQNKPHKYDIKGLNKQRAKMNMRF